MASKYTVIVCSGAGVAGGIFAGGIKKLQELRLVDEVDTYIGTSAGSFVATMSCLGYTPDECQEKLLNYDISSTFQLDPLHFFKGYALSSANGVISFLYYLLGDDKDITFDGVFKKTRKNLVITGTNLSKQTVEFFDKTTHPDMSVALAMRISSSIPFVWPYVSFDGCTWCDGGVSDNLALDYLDPDVKAVGLRFLHPTSGNPTGVIDYFSRIQSTMTTHETPDENPNHSIIPLDTTISATDFKVTKEELQELFTAGYDTVDNYYRTIKGALPREIGETFLSL